MAGRLTNETFGASEHLAEAERVGSKTHAHLTSNPLWNALLAKKTHRKALQTLRCFTSLSLAALLVFGMAPAELWAEGAEAVSATLSDVVGGGEPSEASTAASSADKVSAMPKTSAEESTSNLPKASVGESAATVPNTSVEGSTSASSSNPPAPSWVETNASPTNPSSSLADVAAKLEDERPTPTYGVDTNMNDVVEGILAEMGETDIDVCVDSVEYVNQKSGSDLAVSAADDATNGDITYFFLDPDNAGWMSNYVQWCQLRITYALSRGGETVLCTPDRAISIPWDEAKVEQMLRQDAESLAPGFTAGDSSSAVTSDLTLPNQLQGKSWSEVTWESSDPSVISVDGYAWEDYTGTVKRQARDVEVTLTATIGVSSNGGPSTKVTVPFTVTVAGDPQKLEAERRDLQEKVDASFTVDALTYSADASPVDTSAVAGDIQLPRPGDLGLDGADNRVVYTASSDALAVNGYRANVYQPLPGEQNATVDLTLTVTSKENSEVTASKTLSLEILPLDAQEIEAECALMEEAKAAYAEALLDGADAAAVTGDLHAFQKAYRTADGSLAWAYDSQTSDAAGEGIVPVELPDYDPMGTAGWRLFRSSDSSVVAHENLRVTQPVYNTEVTVTASLSSERFARYAEYYGDEGGNKAGGASRGEALAWAEKFASLANQEVTAAFTVTGTTGEDDPNPEPQGAVVSVRVTGVTEHEPGEDYEAETWVPLTEVVVEKNSGATAWSVFCQVLDSAGYSYDAQGYLYPYSITSPDGRTLASTSSAPYSYWSFYVNGGYASVGANQYVDFNDGDILELKYVDGTGTEVPSGDVVLNPDAEHPALDVEWNGFANGGAGSVTGSATPSAPVEATWTHSLLTEDEQASGAYATASDPLIIAGKLYVVSSSSVWPNTKSPARLEVIDPATGSVERRVELSATLDSVCRPVYADGIIVVPLAEGRLQALSASTLETMWVVEGIDGAQSLSSLTVADGYVYAATADTLGASYIAEAGTVRRINLYTGAIANQLVSDESGYYWAGAAAVDGYYIVGNDAGEVAAYTADLSRCVSSVDVGASVRSTIVETDGYLYATTSDGVLHKLALSDAGELTQAASVKFGSSSTSTPSVAGGMAYVGGFSTTSYENEWGYTSYYGVLAVIDVDHMEVVKSVLSSDGEMFAGDVKSAPLVSQQDSGTYVYFTCNALPGGVYCYRLGDASASTLFTPEEPLQNYAMSSVFVGSDGTLYYTNDSGTLFALRSQAGAEEPEEGGDDAKPGEGTEGGSGQDAGEGSGGEGAEGAGSAGDGMGDDATPAAPVAGGAVAPGARPVSSRGASTRSAQQEAATLSEDAGEPMAINAADGARAGISAETLSTPVNSWALAGIAAGVVGLVCVGIFLFGSKRRGE